MDYEEEYSKYQVHFLGEEPEFLDTVDIDLSNRKVVDLGCGGGINSYYIKRKYPHTYLVPIDISFIRCLECKSNTVNLPVQADILDVPLKSGSVDVVVCTMVIEHLAEDRGLLREILRVLKNGGLALVSSVVRSKGAWYFRKNKAGMTVLDSTHVREYKSIDEFKKLFGNFRIKQVVVREISFSPLRFLYRVVYKLRLAKTADAKFFLTNRWLSKIAKFKLNVPNYRAVEIFCEKRESLTT